MEPSFFGLAFRRLLAAAVALPLCVGPAAAQPVPIASPETADVLAFLQALRNRIPRDRFDAAAVIQHLPSTSPKALFAFVRDETRLVPYRGMLRGARGVLMDGLGNSLDRALLLAELLRQTGVPVRLVTGVLASHEAEALVAQPIPALVRTRFPTIAAHHDELHAWAAEVAVGFPEVIVPAGRVAVAENPIADTVARQFQAITQLLDGHWLPLSEPVGQDLAAADHWWVQYQAGDAWIDLDPSRTTAEPGDVQAKVAGTFVVDGTQPSDLAVPDSEWHTLTISVTIEQWSGGALQRQEPLSATIVPAFTIETPISLQFTPAELPTPDQLLEATDLGAFLLDFAAAQRSWAPQLSVGGQSIAGGFFDAAGYLGPPPAAGGGGLFGIFDAFAEALREPGHLTAVWVEYAIREPVAGERIVTREVVDLIGPAAREDHLGGRRPLDTSWSPTPAQERERALALTERIEIVPQVSNHDPAFASARLLAGLQTNVTAYAAVEAGDRDVMVPPPIPGPAEQLAVLRREWSPETQATFIGSINLLTAHHRLGADQRGAPTVEIGLDIVANNVTPMPGADADPLLVRLLQGIVDTNAEVAMLPNGLHGGNAARLFGADLDRGVAWSVVTSPDELAALSLPSDVAASIRAAIAEGYIAVAPTEAGARDDEVGWWRIDPTAGEAVGIGPNGWGQGGGEYPVLVARTRQRGEGLTEYLIVLSMIFICVEIRLAAAIFDFVENWANRHAICVPAHPGYEPDYLIEERQPR